MKYIIIEREPFIDELYKYHIEKIETKKEVLEIIEKNHNDFLSPEIIIVTNDTELLSKYILTINKDELLMICEYDCPYDESNIRINKNQYHEYYPGIYELYQQIEKGESLSISDYTLTESQTWSHYGVDHHDTNIISSEWIENLYFKYSKRNLIYNSQKEIDKFIKEEYLNEADYKKFDELFLVDFENEVKNRKNLKLENKFLNLIVLLNSQNNFFQ